MASKVQPRPTHYEMLGLTAAASEADINAAFAKKISLFGAFPAGAAAEVCIAYETLRNPVRRRDYDLALGLTHQPREQPKKVTIAVPQQRWKPFIASVAHEPAAQRLSVPDSRSADLRERPFPGSTGPRQFAEGAANAEPEIYESSVALNHRRGETPPPIMPRERRSDPVMARSLGQEFARNEVIGWSRTGLALGAIVLAVVVLGAWAGTIAGNDAQTAGTASIHRVQNSKPLPRAGSASAGSLSIGSGTPSRPAQSSMVGNDLMAQVPVQRRHGRLTQRANKRGEARPTDALPLQSPDSAAPSAVSAANEDVGMPLPRSVIARTIDRIGYRCGEVSSTSPSGSAPGVFRVSCTSGDRYQATPVSGRYHFRRLGRG